MVGRSVNLSPVALVWRVQSVRVLEKGIALVQVLRSRAFSPASAVAILKRFIVCLPWSSSGPFYSTGIRQPEIPAL